MSLAAPTQCVNNTLPARPDIEGIGTRIATYSQLFLTIFTITLSPVQRSFDAWWAALVTSLGLQFAAIAQRAGLTLFHALIITWLAFPVFAMSWPYIFLHWRGDAMPPEILIATHVHGFLFVGFGLWTWSTAPTFGPSDCHDLNKTIKVVVLGKSVEPLGWFRIFTVVLYAVWGLLFLIAAAATLFASWRMYMQKHHHHHSSSPSASKRDLYLPSSTVTQVCVTIFNLLALGLGIWSVESLLLRNEASQTRGAESEWTFGQISATILLVGPGFTFMRLLRMRIFGPSHDHPPSLDREGMPIREMGTSGGTENEEKQQASPSSLRK